MIKMTAVVPGLFYQPDLISADVERQTVQYLDGREWSTKLSRRTQHFGYEYDYKSRKVPVSASPLGGPIKQIADYLAQYNILNPTQCIVNEYTKTQGISGHTDSFIFGDTVVSVSLSAPCEMIFTKDGVEKRITLMPRSMLVMSGEARNSWKHEIKGTVKVPLPDGTTYTKPGDYRRISLTYRTVK